MKTGDCDILILPGYAGSGEEHWQARWAGRLRTGWVVAQADWHQPDPEDWRARIVAAVEAATRFPAGVVRGAMLVAFPDIETCQNLPASVCSFAPVPRDPLPFPALLVASRTDPHCSYERAEEFGAAWGASVVDAGEAGHINIASGHGPWPEGLMRLAGFMSTI
ncbi:alpha/beta hydrolase [Methylobacterium sp. WL9]|uniref:RBBP9/YdeN family alpha/beta hydrolase n=1 Tax=Methylobacterium sp. WL9 TaxID=2603898 RepID=UPI0011CA4041|nr:alpha/beta hydrolase [Methylobacterium sp. WL9]TXN21464.1 serine hydrolase family protein [Methylobacterium sp. WL9]